MTATSVTGSDNEKPEVEITGLSGKRQESIVADSMAADQEPQYFTGFRMAVIMCTINLSTFIGSLDLGIVATAIPKITQDFHSLDDIGWYGGACFLTVGCFSAMWGKMYKYFPAPYVYMSSVSLYLIGSIVAAAAPNSIALIIGRAIQGWGCSGSLSGSVLLINFTAKPEKRPLFIGIWMGIFMTATILGPLLGGVFTTTATWRWCFWINLPIGGLALVLQVLFLRVPEHVKPARGTWKEILLHLDLPGFSLLLTSLICFTLALQWGGLTKPWSDGSVIATLVMFTVLTTAYVAVQWISGPYASMPFEFLKSRKTWANCIYCWIANGDNFQILFFVPLYLQSIKGQSAIVSGVNTLPYVAFFAFGAIVSGMLIEKTRLVQPLQVASGLISIIGTALLYCMDINTSKAWYIGAQIPFGFGKGLGNQVAVISLQAFSKPEDVAAITGMLFVWQTVSGAYFVTAANSLYENKLLQTLAETAPQISPNAVLQAGASGLQKAFSGVDLNSVVDAYMVGIKVVFAFSIALSAFSILVAFLIPFDRIPEQKHEEAEKTAMVP